MFVPSVRRASFWVSLEKFDFFAISKSSWYLRGAALKMHSGANKFTKLYVQLWQVLRTLMHFWLFDADIHHAIYSNADHTWMSGKWTWSCCAWVIFRQCGYLHWAWDVQVSHPNPEVMHKGKAAHPNWNLDVHVMHSDIQLWYISIDKKTASSIYLILTIYGVFAISLDFQCFMTQILGCLKSLDSSL